VTTTLLVPMGNTLITKGMTTNEFVFCLRCVTHRTFHTNKMIILFKPHHLHQREIHFQTRQTPNTQSPHLHCRR